LTGILITGGRQPDYRYIEQLIGKADYITAADSGLEYCLRSSIRPDYIIGDMDSLTDRSLLDRFSSEIVEIHPVEKDFTDTELGLTHLTGRGMTRNIIVGGGGGRLDHLLAIRALFDREQAPDLWITHNSVIRLITGKAALPGIPGEEVSLFPAGHETCRMRSSGLKWPLDQLVWNRGDFGISNLTTGKSLTIEMVSGRLIMIQALSDRTIPV